MKKAVSIGPFEIFTPDPDVEYERIIDIDLSALRPTVSFPHLPENTKTIDEVGDVAIDQVVIGSCTNGRLSDLAAAAEILKGKSLRKMYAASSSPEPSRSTARRCMQVTLISSWRQAAPSPHRPAVHASAGIWESWRRASGAWRRPTATLSAGWAM